MTIDTLESRLRLHLAEQKNRLYAYFDQCNKDIEDFRPVVLRDAVQAVKEAASLLDEYLKYKELRQALGGVGTSDIVDKFYRVQS